MENILGKVVWHELGVRKMSRSQIVRIEGRETLERVLPYESRAEEKILKKSSRTNEEREKRGKVVYHTNVKGLKKCGKS